MQHAFSKWQQSQLWKIVEFENTSFTSTTIKLLNTYYKIINQQLQKINR